MKNLWKKKAIIVSSFLFVCLFGVYGLSSAEDKCPYHQQHVEECGYVEEIKGVECQHVHDDSCYKEKMICLNDEHTHNDECYEKTLECLHQHDKECGYVEAKEGAECTHICSYCDKTLERIGKINVDTNGVHIESVLNGQSGEDKVYFYLKMNESLLDKSDLQKVEEGYKVVCSDMSTLIFEPIYLSEDNENVYLKYHQDYQSVKKYNIRFHDFDENQKISLMSASSFNELDQKLLTSVSLKQESSIISKIVDQVITPKTGIDFKDWIQEITVQHRANDNSAWQDVVDGKVKEHEQLRFNISYTIPGDQLSEENNTIVYQLPSGIKAVKESSGKVFSDTNEEVGTYVIQSDGLIKIEFNDDFVEKNMKGQQINGFISFQSSVDSLNTDENGNIDLGFKDNLDIDLIVEDKINNTNDLQVNKERINEIDHINGIVTFKITVTSENGTGSEVILTDRMNEKAGMKYIGEFVVKCDDKEIVLTNPPKVGDREFTLHLPQMSAGQTYTITYKAQLMNPITNGKATGTNRVWVESTNNGGAKLNDHDYVEVPFNNVVLKKSGWRDGNIIHWTIVVNESQQDIGGWTLSDTINGEALPANKLVNITPAVGGQSQINLPFEFPEGSKDTYTITYDTEIDRELGDGGTTNNIATIKPDDDGKGIDSGVGIGNGYYNPLHKSSKDLIVNPDGETANITWNIQLDTTLGEIKAPWTLKEELQSGQWFTVDQYNEVVKNINAAFANKNLTYTFEQIVDSSTKRITGFKVHFTSTLPQGENISFDVQSTAPITSLETSQTYKNTVSIGNISKEADKTYQGKKVVKKYDLTNGKTEDSKHDFYDKELDGNGVLKWGVEITLPINHQKEELYIHEKLPDGVHLIDKKGLEMKVDGKGDFQEIQFKDNRGSIVVDGETVDASIDGQIIKIHMPAPLVEKIKDQKIYLYVRTKIDDEFNWPSNGEGASFKNEVDVSTTGGTIIGKDDQTQVITKDWGTGTVEKTNGKYEDAMIPYSIHINPENRDLLAESDSILLKDVMSYTIDPQSFYSASLVPNSVEIYYRNKDGSKGDKLSEDLYSYTYKETTEDNIRKNELIVTIPDSQALIVEYKYKIIGNAGIKAHLDNVATLEGMNSSASGDKNEIEIAIKESEAGATIKGVFIYKVDSENTSQGLSGAEFDIWKWNKDQKIYEKKNTKTLVTDKEGKLLVGDLAYNTAYKLVETKAPDGYLKSKEPYYFIIINEDKGRYPECKPDDFNGEYKMFGDLIYYSNVKNATEIQVKKVWQDANGNEITISDIQVQFELWKKVTDTTLGSNIVFEDVCMGEYELSAENGWTLTIPDLVKFGVENVNGKDIDVAYTYYVVEKQIENFETSYDQNEINEGIITIINRNLLVLPETGGRGPLPYMILGLSMMGIAIVFFQKNKHRKMKSE